MVRGDSSYYPKLSPLKFYPKGDGKPEVVAGGPTVEVAPGGPFASFIAAVRRRDLDGVNATVEMGHYSSALCHLANISYRLGEPVPFNKKSKALGDNKQVVDAFTTIKENLKAVDVSLEETTYRLGRTLNLDVESERFTGEDQANELLSRRCRKPFVVPETV